MTIGAAPVEYEPGIDIPRGTGMSRVHVTLGAQPWVGDFEQPVVYRAVRLMAIGAIFYDRGMLPEKRPAPLSVARVTGFINACLYELRRIGRAVRIVAVGANHFAFAQRHVRRPHELGFALQVTLTADFDLRPVDGERSFIGEFGELFAAGFFHERVAIDTRDAAARVGARFPISLHAAPMAAETGFVLDLGRFPRVLAERDHPAHALAAAGGDMVTAGTMATLAGPPFSLVARVE